MPDIKLRNQPFDLAFHPSEPLVYASLLTGEVKSWRFDPQTGEPTKAWSVRPTKRTARALAVEGDGKGLWMGGKSGIICRIDAATGTVLREHEKGHDAPVNRVSCVNEQLVATGDDEGVIKFWDPRTKGDSIRTYTQHWDYISDFLYFEDKKQLITTSGDGHLSVIDVRSNKTEPLSTSADQEDELLSIVPVKNGTKCVVGTGLGVLSIWNRKKGLGDCVDRFIGHPASVDALVPLTEDVVATGSEDGMVRVINILPNRFLGVIAEHEEYPIERLALDPTGKWLGSVSHDLCVKLTDVEGLLEDDGEEDEEMDSDDDEEDVAAGGKDADEEDAVDEEDEDDGDAEMAEAPTATEDWGSDSDVEMDRPKKKKDRGPKIKSSKDKSKRKPDEDAGFFDDL